MVYADFPYYQDFFYGTAVTDAEIFRTAAARASDYLDSVTFGRLENGIPEAFVKQVKDCCCAIAEAFVIYQLYGSGFSGAGNSNQPKTSETQHNYSVSYATPADTLTALLGSDSSFSDYVKSLAMRYLGRTGLLYRGTVGAWNDVYEL